MEELIGSTHLEREMSEVIERMDIRGLLLFYKGDGACAISSAVSFRMRFIANRVWRLSLNINSKVT